MFTTVTKTVAAAAVALALTGPANAAITWTFSPYGQNPGSLEATLDGPGDSPGQNKVLNFGGGDLGHGYSYTQSGDAGVFDGADGLISGVAAPVATGPDGYDTSLYEVLQAGGSFNLKTPGIETLSVYVGSLDSYNEITFKSAGGFSQSFWGDQLGQPANGDQQSGATNGRFDFNFGKQKIDEVDFYSAGNSFEFNYVYAAVPEPSAWLMMIGGLGLVGGALRRARRTSAAFA
jgi:hypothetical protein